MKKSLLCLIGILIAFTANSQYVEGDYGIFRETIAVNDSVVDTIYQGTVPDIEKVNLLILGAIDTAVSSVDSFYVAGQDVWVGNGDTIYKVDTAIISDTAIYALNAGDSTWVRIDADSAYIAYIKTGNTVINSTSVTTNSTYSNYIRGASSNYHLNFDEDPTIFRIEDYTAGEVLFDLVNNDDGTGDQLIFRSDDFVMIVLNGIDSSFVFRGNKFDINNYVGATQFEVLSSTDAGGATADLDGKFTADTVTAIKGKFDTIVVGDSIITGTITLNEAVGAENFDSINTTNLSVSGVFNHDYYHAAAYLDEDSTITTSLTTSWIFLGSGSNNKFTNIVADGFSLDGDTLTFDQDAGDARDSVKMCISYSCVSSASDNNKNIFIGIFIKHTGGSYVEYVPVTSSTPTIASGTYYAGPTCTAMPVWLQDGDKIQIRAKCGATTTTLSTKYFKINLGEK